MKLVSSLLLFLALAGCAPVTRVYYLPIDETTRFEGTACGFVPYGGYQIAITEGVRMSITATVSEESLWLSFQFVLEEGRSLRFQSDELTISTKGNSSIKVMVSESNGKGLPSLNLTQLMEYSFPDLHIANVQVPGSVPEVFTLALPVAEADSGVVQLSSIEFTKQIRTGVMTCIQ